MKHLLLTTIAAVVLVGCGESQQSSLAPEAKPEPPTISLSWRTRPTTWDGSYSIHEAAGARGRKGNIEAVKQHFAADTDPIYERGWTILTGRNLNRNLPREKPVESDSNEETTDKSG